VVSARDPVWRLLTTPPVAPKITRRNLAKGKQEEKEEEEEEDGMSPPPI